MTFHMSSDVNKFCKHAVFFDSTNDHMDLIV